MSASQNMINKKIIEVVALALTCSTDGKFLLARRGPGHSGAGSWEFPGGKIESGESQKQALIREINEELGFDLSPLGIKFIAENTYEYKDQHQNKLVKIYLWSAQIVDKPEFKLVDHDKLDWFMIEEIKGINLSEADKYFISLL
ncbi:MAG: (deoxy)nucleoside triphosphate pyrophosphohydrolase [Bdellovibrionota bacterium]